MSEFARVDIYAHIHKALRHFMSDTLMLISHLDLEDPAEVANSLDQLETLLDACRDHLERENMFVHPAIEARRPGASAGIECDHYNHLATIAVLRAESAALLSAPSTAAAQALYRRLAEFVGHSFELMAMEEVRHNAALWSAYSDLQLHALHDRILASIDSNELTEIMRWMMPALTPSERAHVIGSLAPKIQAPMMALMSELLPATDWAKLCRALRTSAVAA